MGGSFEWCATGRGPIAIDYGKSDSKIESYATNYKETDFLMLSILRNYWLQLLSIAIFVAAAWKYWRLGDWESNLRLILIAFFGLVSVIAAEEMMEWSGHYRWSHSQFVVTPDWWIRGMGFIALVVTASALFWRG
jgi:hypothetical protein